MVKNKFITAFLLAVLLLAFSGCWETVYGPVLVNKTSAPVGVEVVTTSDRLKVVVPAHGNFWNRYPLGGEINSVIVSCEGKSPVVLNKEYLAKELLKSGGTNNVVILIQSDSIQLTSKPEK